MIPVLQILDLKKSFGKIQALNRVSFEVPKGSVFGLLGPNGSGKTTLLSILLDVLSQDSGSFKWFGENTCHLHRKRIGSLLETPNFYHYLTAVQNLRITQQISGRGNDSDIEAVLKRVNLFERRHYRFSTYSLGMKQRLAMAAVLLGNPEVMVLDEPTNGLDPVGIAEIRTLIKNLASNGHTIIMASHLLDEVEKVCDHVAILKLGELIAAGTVETVLAEEDSILLDSRDRMKILPLLDQLPGFLRSNEREGCIECYIERGKTSTEEINRFFFDRGIVLTLLMFNKKRLEEKFFELTSDAHGS